MTWTSAETRIVATLARDRWDRLSVLVRCAAGSHLAVNSDKHAQRGPCPTGHGTRKFMRDVAFRVWWSGG